MALTENASAAPGEEYSGFFAPHVWIWAHETLAPAKSLKR